MDRADNISVDLKGNALTCHNVGGDKHIIGHVSDFENIKLDTSTHFSHFECCNNCPVVTLCRGGCMYLEGSEWYETCENEYHYNMGLLAVAIYTLTGRKLVGIEGKIVRPKKPNLFPIKVVSV
jgi:uncharacterized protein